MLDFIDHDVKRILVVKMSSIGDVVHSLPLLHALKLRFPSAFIGWVVDRRCKSVLENNPLIDQLYIFERERWGNRKRRFKTLTEAMALVRLLRKQKFDLVIDLQGLFRSGLITYLSGAPIRMGFNNSREMSKRFYNRKVEVPEGLKLHAVDRYMLMGKSLSIETTDRVFTIGATHQEMEKVESLLQSNGIQRFHRLVLINPWARWESKRWPISKFALLGDMLNCEADTRVVVVGAGSDSRDFRTMLSLMKTRVISLVGMTSLSELFYLMKRADLLITNDSGPMHIAAAAGTPVVALFGPTDPRLCGPYGEGHSVLQKELHCSCCYQIVCPTGHQCMEDIDVNEVVDRVMNKLEAIHKDH